MDNYEEAVFRIQKGSCMYKLTVIVLVRPRPEQTQDTNFQHRAAS